jgi:hypothetical protein
MFSLREYLTNLFTLPSGAVDELAVKREIQRVATACQTWGREMRLKDVFKELGA